MTQQIQGRRGAGPARLWSAPTALAAVAALALPVAAAARGAQAAPPAGVAPAAATSPSIAAIIAGMPKNLPRAAAPGLHEAVSAAEAAEQACLAKNAKVSVLIADAVGKPVVLLSGDGAGYRSQLIAQTKVNIVVKYGKPSGDVADAAEKDPRLAAAAAADPDIGMFRGGGFPVHRGGRLIAIVGVSGGSLGGVMGLDEACAKVAVAALEAH